MCAGSDGVSVPSSRSVSFTDSSHWASSGGAVLSAAPLMGCRARADPADARLLRVAVRPTVSVLLQVRHGFGIRVRVGDFLGKGSCCCHATKLAWCTLNLLLTLGTCMRRSTCACSGL